MNQAKIFLALASINFCGASVVQYSIPVELAKQIALCCQDRSAQVLHLEKYNKCDNSSNNEKLYFPSTGFFEFIKANNPSGSLSSQELRKLNELCSVVPHVQFWANNFRSRIDDDLKKIATEYPFSLEEGYPKTILFDALGKLAITAYTTSQCLTIAVRNLEEKGDKLYGTYFIQRCSLSLCLHNNSDYGYEFSMIMQQQGNEMQEIIISRSDNPNAPVHVNMAIPQEIPLINKHESIGKDTFLFCANEKLFFGVHDKKTEKIIFCPQTLWTQKKKGRKELKVLSSSANQDENKRTSAGRARYYAVLASESNGNGSWRQKILMLDLLNPFNILLNVWKSFALVPEEFALFDRISFGGDTISVWNNAWNDKSAMQITLPEDWTLPFEQAQLVDFLNRNNCLDTLIKYLKQ